MCLFKASLALTISDSRLVSYISIGIDQRTAPDVCQHVRRCAHAQFTAATLHFISSTLFHFTCEHYFQTNCTMWSVGPCWLKDVCVNTCRSSVRPSVRPSVRLSVVHKKFSGTHDLLEYFSDKELRAAESIKTLVGIVA